MGGGLKLLKPKKNKKKIKKNSPLSVKALSFESSSDPKRVFGDEAVKSSLFESRRGCDDESSLPNLNKKKK